MLLMRQNEYLWSKGLRGCALRETTHSSIAASRFKYNTLQLGQGEFSLAQWLWYRLLVRKVSGSNPILTLYFCHAFIHLFLCHRLCW